MKNLDKEIDEIKGKVHMEIPKIYKKCIEL